MIFCVEMFWQGPAAGIFWLVFSGWYLSRYACYDFAGIDIEPDFAEYALVNITLRRLLLEKNDGHGFQLVLREFARRPADVLSPITLTLEDVRVKGSFSPTSVRAPALLLAVLFLST